MLLQNLRAKMSARLSGDRESGFTLIELLVVMLILGILAAIAIPAFFTQREKANDAQAKSMVRSAQTAAETYATDNGGLYTGLDKTDLPLIEETITETVSTSKPYLLSATPIDTDKGYEVTVKSGATANEFTIKRTEAGVTSFTCITKGNAGCPADGSWD
jgi:type IV pilus assembly protein PilA